MWQTYRQVTVLAARRSVRSWLAALSIPIYGAVLFGASLLLAPLGLLGGLVLAFVAMACFAGYLYLLADAINGSKLSARDIRQGMRGLWDVCSVVFALWIMGLGVSVLMRLAGPNAAAVGAVAGLAGAFFFNVVPELLCSSRSRSFALLKESAEFVMANPFAWFFPNILLALALLAVTGSLWVSHPGQLLTNLAGLASPAAIAGLVRAAPLWAAPLLIAFVHFAMVFRGLLFQELASGNARLRAFRARMGA
jgi:hypothetical protein